MSDYSSLGLKRMFEYIWNHKTEFRLILKSADGTKYENFVYEMAKKRH